MIGVIAKLKIKDGGAPEISVHKKV